MPFECTYIDIFIMDGQVRQVIFILCFFLFLFFQHLYINKRHLLILRCFGVIDKLAYEKRFVSEIFKKNLSTWINMTVRRGGVGLTVGVG